MEYSRYFSNTYSSSAQGARSRGRVSEAGGGRRGGEVFSYIRWGRPRASSRWLKRPRARFRRGRRPCRLALGRRRATPSPRGRGSRKSWFGRSASWLFVGSRSPRWYLFMFAFSPSCFWTCPTSAPTLQSAPSRYWAISTLFEIRNSAPNHCLVTRLFAPQRPTQDAEDRERERERVGEKTETLVVFLLNLTPGRSHEAISPPGGGTTSWDGHLAVLGLQQRGGRGRA